MVYELRTYWAAEGKLEALHRRFREVTLGVFAKHGMTVVGFWTPATATEESGDLVYLMAFPSEEAMKAAWAAFREDPDWVNGKAQSEMDGVLVRRLTSVVLHPTNYSPIQ
ncbi:MAG: NIPSNAP family protein [Anaerolineae bacterium]|nr:NIPSNAP family protein [Anaerolineae bacterium]